MNPLTYNPENRNFYEGERYLRLPDKEKEVLTLLLQHKNTIVSNKNIDKIFENNDDSYKNICIRNLRNRLQSTNAVIENVRELGYKLILK